MLPRWGWYPRGGGEVRLTVRPQGSSPPAGGSCPPNRRLSRPCRPRRGSLITSSSARGNRLKERLGSALPVAEVEAASLDPGSFVFLWGPRAGFQSLGARGKPAEKVADLAVEEFLTFARRQAALDRHLADQVLLYLAFTAGESVFTTEEITPHLLTNLWVIERFYGPRFKVQGHLGEPGQVTCQGRPE